MGLEIMGFAKSNLNALWIDPYDYRDEIEEAVNTLSRYGMRVSIYIPRIPLESHSSSR